MKPGIGWVYVVGLLDFDNHRSCIVLGDVCDFGKTEVDSVVLSLNRLTCYDPQF
tara:strand:- start:330 stop:491 length:162 start_codon:yes stop_codon:yes gene_type:complete